MTELRCRKTETLDGNSDEEGERGVQEGGPTEEVQQTEGKQS